IEIVAALARGLRHARDVAVDAIENDEEDRENRNRRVCRHTAFPRDERQRERDQQRETCDLRSADFEIEQQRRQPEREGPIDERRHPVAMPFFAAFFFCIARAHIGKGVTLAHAPPTFQRPAKWRSRMVLLRLFTSPPPLLTRPRLVSR